MPATPLSADLLDAPDIVLSEEAQAAKKKDKEDFDKLLASEDLAKYKIEIYFSHRHSLQNPSPGIVTWWESAAKLHGGGDSKLYLCERNNVQSTGSGPPGCSRFIPDSANGLSYIVCPYCQQRWQPHELVGEVFYNLPVYKWAEVVMDWFMRLESRADIRIKYGRMSIMDAQRKEEEKKLQGDILNKARSIDQRYCVTYPLANIIKDTSAGADLSRRFLAFLKA